jgi:hypothetical protein
VTRLQKLGGTLLYYARAVDPTLIMPVNVLASEQTKATAATADNIIKLINQCATHPEATLHYHASDMILMLISPSSQPDRALPALNYGLTPTCNISQLSHERTPITSAHTTGNSNTNLSQVSYRNLLRSQYKQGCNQCEHSHTQVYQYLNTHQLHLNAPYKHISASVSTLPVERTN